MFIILQIQSLFNNIKSRTQINTGKDNNLSDDENRNMPVSKRGRGRGRGRRSTRQKQSTDVNPSKQLHAKRQTKKQVNYESSLSQ